MDFEQKRAARKNPSNWTVATNNGTNVTATNNVTGEAFSGTTIAYNAMFVTGDLPAAAEAERAFIKTGTPAVVGSSGTVATNGIITFDVALPATYTGAWLFLPAGAIVGGAAGMYYAVMSSTTQGQVYAKFIDSATVDFAPYTPVGAEAAALVAAVGSNSAYVQTLTARTLLRYTIPATVMGKQGTLELQASFSALNDAQAKNTAITFGGTTMVTSANTSVAAVQHGIEVQNRGVANRQVTFVDGSAAAPTYSSIDTDANVVVTVTALSGAVGDYIVMESARMEAA
jgi:hypothetical protein